MSNRELEERLVKLERKTCCVKTCEGVSNLPVNYGISGLSINLADPAPFLTLYIPGATIPAAAGAWETQVSDIYLACKNCNDYTSNAVPFTDIAITNDVNITPGLIAAGTSTNYNIGYDGGIAGDFSFDLEFTCGGTVFQTIQVSGTFV